MNDKKPMAVILAIYFAFVFTVLCVTNIADGIAEERREYEREIRSLRIENAILRITPTPTNSPTPTPTPTYTSLERWSDY